MTGTPLSAGEEIRRVGVVGGGLMGSGIAEVCARAGLPVTVVETGPQAVDAARRRIRGSLERAARSAKIGSDEAARAEARITISDELDALAPCDLVVEAVAESEPLKVSVFAELDRIVRDPEAILASNTSSIPIMKLGTATSRPQQVIGVHFFNPVPVLKLVELVPSLMTSDTTRSRVERFVGEVLGKKTIHCQDRAGFFVNALLVAYLLSAIRMLESGLASAEDIDTGMVAGCAHPLGPLSLADLIGLDTVQAIAESMYAEFKQPLYSPPPLLSRMVDAGLLGRKSSRGFHAY
jgi:3-hydroxybutyryl-CoA dehydrogenase